MGLVSKIGASIRHGVIGMIGLSSEQLAGWAINAMDWDISTMGHIGRIGVAHRSRAGHALEALSKIDSLQVAPIVGRIVSKHKNQTGRALEIFEGRTTHAAVIEEMTCIAVDNKRCVEEVLDKFAKLPLHLRAVVEGLERIGCEHEEYAGQVLDMLEDRASKAHGVASAMEKIVREHERFAGRVMSYIEERDDNSFNWVAVEIGKNREEFAGRALGLLAKDKSRRAAEMIYKIASEHESVAARALEILNARDDDHADKCRVFLMDIVARQEAEVSAFKVQWANSVLADREESASAVTPANNGFVAAAPAPDTL